MNSSEHVSKAIVHLLLASQANHDHLLLEKNYNDWHQQVLAKARASAACSVLTEVHAIFPSSTESWAVPDFGHLRDEGGQPIVDR